MAASSGQRPEGWVMGAEFPLDALPKPLADLAKAASAAGNFPPEFVAAPGLSVLAAAIGPRAVLRLQAGFRALPILWTYVVASPGAAKGPGQRYATAPFEAREALWARQHAEAMASYEADLRDHALAAAKLGRGDERPQEPTPPSPQRHCIVATTTIEGLAEILRDNPASGILWAREELSAIVGALDQYHPGGKGDGRAAFLELHDGRPISIVRKGTSPIYVPAPLVSVCGGAVPTRLGPILGDDGLPPRFLGVHRPEAGLSLIDLDQDMPPAVVEAWDALVQALITRPGEGSALPALEPHQVVEVRLSPAAMAKWKAITAGFRATWERGETSTLGQEVLGKASAHLASTAVVLHCAECPTTIRPEIAGETMERAGELISHFVAAAAALETLEPSAAADRGTRDLDDGVVRLIAWLRRRGKIVSIRDVLHAHVAGLRDAKEVARLVARYEATYPDCVASGRRPGVEKGPIGVLVVAPGGADLFGATTGATGATGATDMSARTPLPKIIPQKNESEFSGGGEINRGGESVAPVAPVAPVVAGGEREEVTPPLADTGRDGWGPLPAEALASGPDLDMEAAL